jgi:filamentous hemagglutinin family protein
MNQNLYRTVFSKALGMLVPVAEIARAHGKGAGRMRGVSPAAAPVGLSAIASAVAAVLCSVPALAAPPTLPTDGVITGGAGTISQNGTTLTINQASDKLTATWKGFDIGAGYGVVFNQPGRSSVALNRVTGTEASRIYGSLTANGHVFLVNPNGVLFAPGAQVNVGGLAASTLGISDEDFAAGRYRFTQGTGAGSVVNEGQITAGSVVLIGPKIANSGTIRTPGGRTTFAAGDQVTVSMLDGLLSATVDASVANAEIRNSGRILADGGRVDLIAGRVDTVLNSLINVDGVIQARTLREDGGRIFLDGGAGGTVTVSGSLDASGAGAGERGGAVTVLGKNVGLMAGADVNASGDAGGGTVLVGGNWQGTGPEHHARATYMDRTATIRADATGQGNGGKVVLWSDEYTGFYGSISARGGANGGNGGAVETSSHDNLQAFGQVNASAPAGAAGTWLLDPTDVTIVSGSTDANVTTGAGVFDPTGTPGAQIGVANINTNLNNGTNVTINTASAGTDAGNITLDAAATINKTAGGAASLTLNAAGGITLNGSIASSSNALEVTLNANGGAIGGTGNVNTNGGLLTFNAASGSGTLSGAISGSGGVIKKGAGTLRLTSNASNYTGDTIIDGGRLVFAPSAIVTAPSADFYINTGSTLEFANATRVDFVGARHMYFDADGGGTVEFNGTISNGGVNMQPGASLTFHSQGGLQNVVRSTSGPGVNIGPGGTVALDVAAGGEGLLFSSPLWNTGSLVKTGAGLAVLTANNTYAGTTTVDAGTLQLGAGGTTGTLGTGAVTVNAAGTLRWFRSNAALVLPNSISGAGTLEFLGTGVSGNSDYVLNGNNSGFNGAVVIDRARVQYDNANDLGAGAAITVLAGGQLLASASLPNAINLNGTGWLHSSGTLGALRLANGAAASGNIVLQSDANISAAGSTGTVSGVISGPGQALQIQGGTLTMSAANTFTGPLTIQSGSTLVLAPGASLATDTINIGTISSGGSGSSVLQHQGDNQIANATLNFDGAAPGEYAYWMLLGTNQSVRGINDNSNNGVIENTETQNGFGNSVVTLTGSGSYSYNGYFRDRYTGTSGTLALVKAGTGTQALVGGRSNYAGPTTVNAGTLVLSNAPAFASATTVNAGATLELAGNININHTAGFSLTLNDGSRLVKTNSGYNTFNVSNVTVNGTTDIEIANSGASNQLFIGGATTGLAGSGTINLTNTGSATTGVTLRSGAGSFSGAINVDGGALNVASGAALALQNTDVNLAGSARLNLAGAFSGGATPASVKSLSGASDTTVTLGGQTLTVGANNGTGGNFAGVVSGTGGFAKTGTGTQLLTGNNTYTGATTISGGTLQIGNGGTTGTLGTGAVTNNGSLVFDRTDVLTVANTIGGSGSLTQAGPGTVILTGNNTYGGTTTVADGTLQVGNNGATGRLGTGAVTNNGNLVFNRSDSTSLGVLAAGGITGTGNVTALIGGALNVDRSIALTGASSAILLEAGKNQPAGTATGGDVTLTSNISTSAGGTITIFSGNASTAAYEAMVGGATGTTRYKTYNANAAATGGAVAGTRNYYYRQGTVLSVGGLAATKVYDGLRDVAAVDTTGAVVNGLIDGDTLAAGALNVTGARLDSAHAGARTLDATVSSATGPTYAGGGATWAVAGYSTAAMTGSGTGTVTPRQLTVGVNAVGKTYDGQTSTSSTLGALSGFAGGDNAAGVNGVQLAFDSANAGMRNIVATGTPGLAGFTGTARGNGSGIGAGNEVAGLASDYTVTVAPATATISPAALTVRANNDAKIVTQGDTAGYNGVSFSGFVNGEGAAHLGGTLAIARTNAGTEGAGNYTGVLQPSGYTSGNYTITFVPGDYRILPAEQLLVRIQNVTNTYGTVTGYAVTSAQYLGADNVIHDLAPTAHSGNTYTYTDGAGGSVTFTVTPQGAVTSGAGHLAAGNYTLAGGNVTIGGNNFDALHFVGNQTVDRAALTPLAGGVSKVYDGTTAMTGLTLGLGGLLAGDAVTTGGSGAFASRNAGTNLTYYVNGMALSGADAGNYYLTAGSLTGNDGTITPRPITLTAVPASKVYDGTTSAPGTPLVNGSLVGGDSFTRLAQEFASANVGNNVSLIPIGLIEDGNGGANYVLTFVESPLGQILPVAGPPRPAADPTLPSQAPVAAALHRGEDAADDNHDRLTSEADDERLRRQVQVISSGLRLPTGLGASRFDDFQRDSK